MSLPNPEKLRIGQILVQMGALNPEQVRSILTAQEADGRPFGQLAEAICGLDPAITEAAWVEQYTLMDTAVTLADRSPDPVALTALTARQAWQFGLVAVGHEGGQLVLATTRERLAKAARFAWRRLHEPVLFLIADADDLDAALRRWYPWAGVESLAQLAS